jgi:hypothetical protein
MTMTSPLPPSVQADGPPSCLACPCYSLIETSPLSELMTLVSIFPSYDQHHKGHLTKMNTSPLRTASLPPIKPDRAQLEMLHAWCNHAAATVHLQARPAIGMLQPTFECHLWTCPRKPCPKTYKARYHVGRIPSTVQRAWNTEHGGKVQPCGR